jgi:predicted kinase
MLEVVMTSGIPGCGKTTFAQKWLEASPTTRARANRDDIRAMIGAASQHNSTPEFEKLVGAILFKTIWEELKNGRDVIVDNTHMQPKYFFQMHELLQDFANQFKKHVRLTVEVLDVDYDVCLARNAARTRVVPEHVISKMHDNFKKIKKFIADNYASPTIIHPQHPNTIFVGAPNAIICDIDGTLGDLSHRDPYDFSKVLDDGVHTDIVDLLALLAEEYRGTKVFIISGRDDSCYDDTKLWLDTHGIVYDALYMRKAQDTRSDRYVKEDIYNEHIKGKYNVRFVLDDRDQVVRTWRNLGLRCLQVAYGEF